MRAAVTPPDLPFLSALLAASPDCVTALSLEGQVLYTNHGKADAHGRQTISRIQGGLFLDFWPLSERGKIAAAIASAAAGEATLVEGFCPRSDGAPCWWETRFAPVPAPDGLPLYVVGVSRDVSERHRADVEARADEELPDADRRKTEFLATLAHELRNPLAPLRNGLALLARTGDRPESMAKVRDMMERQLAQMVHLINDLLDIARITSGKLQLKTDKVDLKSIVSMAVEAVAPELSNTQHTLYVELPAESIHIVADPTRLTQVFTNILNNAARYSAPGGRIALSAAVVGEFAEIRIVDNGRGISKASLNAIFEMFTQVGRDTRATPGGLGIGLNLVRRLVELHGGTVAAESEGEDLGSTFIVRLPLAEQRVENNATLSVPADGGAGMRILIVDDNADAADTMGMLLSLGNHMTRVAHSGAEALNIVADFQPDIAFLDIGMPIMNGFELAQQLRALPTLSHVTLVALTGWGGEEDRKRTRAAGFDEHLTKPADLESVERLLTKLQTAHG